MKVAFLTLSLEPLGGWGRYAVDVIRCVAALGIQGVVIIPRGEEKIPDLPLDVREVLPMSKYRLAGPYGGWFARRRLRRALADCDLVHVLTEPALPCAVRAGRGIPVLMSIHGAYGVVPFREPVFGALKTAMHKVDAVCYSSRYTQRRVHEFCQAPLEEVILLGVDIDGFSMKPRSAPAEGRPVRILSVGAFKERKGFRYLVEAMDHLRRWGVEVRLTICGHVSPQNNFDAIQNLAKKLDLEDRVTLIPDASEDKLRQCYAEADLFALAAVNAGKHVEGFGLVYLEAGADGMPVIGTHDCGAEDAILDGRTGLLAPQRDAETLAGAIRDIVTAPDRYESMSREGVEWARKQAWPNVARRMVNFYERVLTRVHGPTIC